MFNSAYAVGGPVCAVKTVETLTGVRMDHYLEIDFSGFARLVDALGGVDVTTDEDIDDEQSHLHLRAGSPPSRRQAGPGPRPHPARHRRRQRPGPHRAATDAGQGAAGAALRGRSAHRPRQCTRSPTPSPPVSPPDTGLDSLNELVSLGRSLRELTADRVRTVTMPVVTAPADPNRVVADEPAAGELWASLR